MNALIGIAALVVGVPLLAALIGCFLPRDHVARMTIDLNSPPGRVWSVIADFGGTTRWRHDVTGVKVSGQTPLRFVETSKHGDVSYEVVNQEPPREQVVRIVDDGQPFGGTWRWELEPHGDGTRLTITEAGFVKNPLFRVMAKLFFKPTQTMNGYLHDLARELNDDAAPREVAASS
jgi:uncharacterized protein YndB with AHSA1/START domain